MTVEQKEDAMAAVKQWLFPILFAGVISLIQYQYSGIHTDIKELKKNVQELVTLHAVYNRDLDYIQKDLENLKKRVDRIEENKKPGQ